MKNTKLSKFISNNTSTNTHEICKSCIKWAGGKSKLLSEIFKFTKNTNTLYDVFAGSAVIGLNSTNPKIVLNDLNSDLVDMYINIKNKPKQIIQHLTILFNNHSEKEFYRIRDDFNNSKTSVKKTAMFIYLNKTGFNGLCRYNKSGKLNIPFGKTSSGKPATSPKQQIIDMSKTFNSKDFVFLSLDFMEVLKSPISGDVVILDPPYTPINKDGFVNYSGKGFTKEQHDDMALEAIRLMNLGVVVIIFDHDLPITRKRHEHATTIVELNVSRSISKDGKNRKKVAEIMAIYRK